MRTVLTIRLEMPGAHFWAEAIHPVEFLKFEHRHVFHFEMKFSVTRSDRELEFFIMQNQIRLKLMPFWDAHRGLLDFKHRSCEHIAEFLMEEFPDALEASVIEDGENGATVYRT